MSEQLCVWQSNGWWHAQYDNFGTKPAPYDAWANEWLGGRWGEHVEARSRELALAELHCRLRDLGITPPEAQDRSIPRNMGGIE